MNRHLTILICAALMAPPALAQNSNETPPSAMERWLEFFTDELSKELGPALEEFKELGPELRNFMTEMGPALGELMGEIKDWSLYHAPEILPNGDIIIRRKSKDELPPEDGQIDI